MGIEFLNLFGAWYLEFPPLYLVLCFRFALVYTLGLGLVLCVLIVFFLGTWYLPALFAVCAVGMVSGYLYWLDGQQFAEDR